MRAAGMPPIITVADPLTIESGGPTQVAISPTRAAGISPIITVGHPGPEIGPPTCGIGGTPGVHIGQRCMSVSLAAGGMIYLIKIVGSFNDMVKLMHSCLTLDTEAAAISCKFRHPFLDC